MVKAPGVIDWAKCNNNPAGHTLPGTVLNRFEFCRWGFNTATKLNGQGQIEGQVKFKETEVGSGSNSERTLSIYLTDLFVSSVGVVGVWVGGCRGG
ncbi:hypothetical protein, partial [Streptomyces albipurpureus]